MEYFIQYTSSGEAEYVTTDFVLPIRQVDQFPVTDDYMYVKSTIRGCNGSTFKGPYDPSLGAKY